MQFTNVRSAAVIGGAVAIVLGVLVSPGAAQCGCGAPAVAPVAACAPVVAPVPVRANRIMWTPSYGIASTCNPFVAQSCGYTAFSVPTGSRWGYAPAATYVAASPVMPVTQTTFRPVLYRLFHPFTPLAPLVPTTTYRGAFCAPCAGACAPCAPACAPMTAMFSPQSACAPCASGCGAPMATMFAPQSACDPCAVGGVAPSACGAGDCAPAATETPLPAPSLSPTPAPAYDSGTSAAPSQETPVAETPLPTTGNGGAGLRTYKEEPQPATEPDLRLRPADEPLPDPKANGTSTGIKAPRLLDPVTQRSASLIRPANYVIPASQTKAPAPAKRTIDVSGWRAARD